MALITFYFKVAFEGIATLICTILAVIVYRRSRKNLPNIYMATSFLLFGLYTGGVLVYDIFSTGPTFGNPSDIFIDIFIRVSLVSMLFGGMFLYFAMMGQGHSRMWYSFKKNTLPWIGIVVVYSLVLIVWNRYFFGVDNDWIVWSDIKYQPVDTKLVIFVLIPLIILLFIFLISSTVVLYNFGVKKTEGLRKHNMQRFLGGVIIAIVGVVINVLGQLGPIGDIELGGPDLTLSQILDLVFFAVIVLSVATLFSGIAVRSKRKNPINQDDMEEQPAKST